MWPFTRKSSAPPLANVTKDGVIARYDCQLKQWVFQTDGIEFYLSGIPFDENAIGWAKEAAAVIHTLEPTMRARVLEFLEGWPCNKSEAKILCVDLDGYGTEKTFDVAYIGDDSWGDFGVNVIIANGEIVDVCGGD